MNICKGFNLSNKDNKIISNITPFTTLDFKEHLACIVWFSGCNMRCPYCYNKEIVFENGNITKSELVSFLKTRQRRLDAVVLSGGECTMYNDLSALCKEIKDLNFKIKIDTNGTNPHVLKSLIKDGVIDYVALDYKAPRSKFKSITRTNLFNLFEETLNLLITSNMEFEARTTIHFDLLCVDDINEIILDLYNKGYKNKYYIQKFLYTEDNIGNIHLPKKDFDLKKLSHLIPLELRNF